MYHATSTQLQVPLVLRPLHHFLRHVRHRIHFCTPLLTIRGLQITCACGSHDLAAYETINRGVCFRYEVMYYGIFITVRYGDVLTKVEGLSPDNG
jgi:hypothetical protein